MIVDVGGTIGISVDIFAPDVCAPNLALELTSLMQDVIVDTTGALYAAGQRVHKPSARLQRRMAPTRARRNPLAACVPS
jgi:hypothetical protein